MSDHAFLRSVLLLNLSALECFDKYFVMHGQDRIENGGGCRETKKQYLIFGVFFLETFNRQVNHNRHPHMFLRLERGEDTKPHLEVRNYD
jgi:hypothetical protein